MMQKKFQTIFPILTVSLLTDASFVTVTSREIIDYPFNATNIRTFEARNNNKAEISKRS